ncbi:DeoR family transcriptional regulator [Salmonella enterica subsp. enterica]|uniref:DeoR family transcriptional regulator n=1 Tax=Salmonella enterica I TaxID=59201 RepID=A0A447PAD6_SALET|nr:DeoR family transcriptional regulator [Salmonella enterica subsp. enterica]
MWVEDPGFPLIRPVITQEGITLAPIPVDADGLNVAAGMAGLPAGTLCIGDARPSKSVGGGAVVNSPTATSGMGGECAGLDY